MLRPLSVQLPYLFYIFVGVSSDQQLSPRVQDVEEDDDDDDVEEVVFEEEVYTEPEIKQEVIEVEDDKPQVQTLRMDMVNVKQEKDQPVVTLSELLNYLKYWLYKY